VPRRWRAAIVRTGPKRNEDGGCRDICDDLTPDADAAHEALDASTSRRTDVLDVDDPLDGATGTTGRRGRQGRRGRGGQGLYGGVLGLASTCFVIVGGLLVRLPSRNVTES
jgi:hypothetical protein